jgi:hypothetical protein
MSEADSLNNAPGLPESVELRHETAAIADLNSSTEGDMPLNPDDDWQTVDFPGALSVDAIPQSEATVALPLDDRSIAAMPPTGDLTEQVQQLQAENAALRQQIARLTTDLVQGQVELQLETARNTYTLPATEAEGRSELATAKGQISRLLQELDLSHQTAQRQQILVETLNEQLANSQERVAQLERECALTQQRFNEQMQQRLQAESTCRDLRMRLHRQQQQTLQFKAALEKSLEMTTQQRQEPFSLEVSDREFDNDRPNSSQLSHLVAPEVLLKNQPVQPWVAPDAERSLATSPLEPPQAEGATMPTAPESQEELPLVTDLLTEEDTLTPIAADAHASLPALPDPQQLGELLNQMFPNQPDESAYAIDAAATANPVFDLSLLLEPGESSTAAMPESSPASGSEAALWADLEKLIHPPAVAPDQPEAECEPESIAPSELSTDSTIAAEIPIEPLPTRKIVLAFEAPVSQNPAFPTQTALQVFNSSPVSPLGQIETPSAPDMPLFASNSPSPVVYPMRSTKKRKSLAAVELPMFPRVR